MKKVILLFSFVLIISTTQSQQKVLADRIIAKVGDRIILYSDIKSQIADVQHQSSSIQLPANVNCMVLQNDIISKLLILQGERDSLKIEDESLEAELDNQIRGFIQMYGSREALEEAADKTVYQIKEDFKQPFRERKLADMMRNKVVETIKITPTEVKAYFDRTPKDSLRYYESALEIGQIVSYPKANKEVEAYVVKELLEYKRQIEQAHKPFELLAKMHSEDPGSKDNGGQYTINRNDKNWDPAFLATAFRLREGQISTPVKSKFGYHIIALVKRNGDDAIVQHILKIPPVTDDEINISVHYLDSVRSKIISGSINFREAVNKYTNDEETKFNGGFITARDGSTLVNIDQLDKDMVLALKNMKPGDISQPQTYVDERSRKAVRIIYLKTLTEPHRENFKDDYNRIAQRATEEKKNEAMQKWFAQKAADYYIYIDDEYKKCDNLKWLSTKTNEQ